MKKDLFHNASLRLTGLYLLIIVSICVIFSVSLYRVGSQELERTLNRPITPVERRLLERLDLEDLKDERLQELAEAQSNLRNRLILLNIIIVVIGGGGSYVLARRTLRPIEEAHEAQSRFTADASHELRTPITAMRAETELTLTEPKLTLKAAKKQLESNIEELDKLTQLSEGLLQLARIDGDGLTMHSVALDDIVNDAVARVSKKAESKSNSLPLKDHLALN